MSDILDNTTETVPEVSLPLDGSENTEIENSVKKPKRQPQLPVNDYDLVAVAKSMLPKWDESILPLVWAKKTEMETMVLQYADSLRNRNTVGASRGSITSSLTAAHKEADKSIEHVKNKLFEIVGSKAEATVRYGEFGIVKERTYKFPQAREARAASFDVLIEALTAYKIEDFAYGTAYWTALKEQYNSLLEQARSVDGSVSTKVGSLNYNRTFVRKFLNSFVQLIKANYPDEWKTKLRDYGFQKEKY